MGGYTSYAIIIRFGLIDTIMKTWRSEDDFDDTNILRTDDGKIKWFSDKDEAIEFITINFHEDLVNPYLFKKTITDKEPTGYKFSKGMISRSVSRK